MKRSIRTSALLFAFVFTLSSCGGNADKSPAAGSVQETTAEPVQEESSTVQPETSNSLTLEGNDQMQYNKTELRVKAGQPITLVFKHTGKMEKTAMGHNFVVLKPGTDLNAFAQKAMTAKDNDYIPKSESASVIAHTKLIGGGESDTIEFTITEKGTYDYICSFPGHFSMMKGKLIVE